MVIVRPATRSDLGQIMRLAAATPEAPHWQPGVYERFLSPSDPSKQLFIAERDETIIGFAAAQLIAEACEVESIVVDASFRRSGVGSNLLAKVVEWATKHGASRLQLEVRAGNNAAIGFYGRAGLRRDGLRRNYYSDPADDALLMSLPFAPSNPP